MQDNYDFSSDLNIDKLISNEGLSNYRDIPKIRVIVRKRPCNKKELTRNDIDIIETRGSQTCVVKELKNKVDLTKYIEEHHFSFDGVFDENATNEMIYLETVRPMVDAAFNKAKVTCFAYGQTGSGKTYTMMGNLNGKDLQCPGLYLLCAYDIFSYLEQERYNHLEIWVSFYEIYCGKLFDLLNERNVLQAREDGKQNICIVGLQEKPVNNLKTLMGIIDFGLKVRTTGITGANMDSSRSHAILQVLIKDENGNVHGKISFIDLAGSERAVDTIDTNRQTKMDGAEINKSLLALKECIRALDQEKKHTPFRGSKLTLVLRDSFMGNCKTLMIANISPCLSCSEHTLNTLRYADRVKELRKDRNDKETFVNNADKDPSELLAQLMMMPRQHTKTIKYNVDIKKNPNLQNLDKHGMNANINLNLGNNNGNRKSAIHINQLINGNQQSKNNVNNNVNNNYRPKTSTSSQHTQSTKDNTGKRASLVTSNINTKSHSNNNLSNNPMYDASSYVSKYQNHEIKSDEDFQKLSNEHEKLINQILQEEEDFIGKHKGHIDDMVELVKQEMGLINEVDKPGSDIESYVGNLDKLLADKVEKINSLRARLLKFNILLKDEEALSSKFNNNNNNDFLDIYDLNKKNFDNDNDNLEDELEEELRAFEQVRK